MSGAQRGKRIAIGSAVGVMLVIVALMALPTDCPPSKAKANEAVLREDLWILRDSINEFFTKNGRYPSSLEDLIDAGYIKAIPVDPITNSADTWMTQDAEPDPVHPDAPGGIRDVRSGATGTTVEGVPYSEL